MDRTIINKQKRFVKLIRIGKKNWICSLGMVIGSGEQNISYVVNDD